MSYLEGKEVLITGGTGSLGKTLVKLLIKDGHRPHGVRVFSRDELKQWQMAGEIKEYQRGLGTDVRVAYIIGDVRNYESLYRAFENVDVVIHAAALKQIPACEDNPIEAVLTNVTGTENVIKAALARNVKRSMYVSTDKAVHAVNLYGATKAVAEKMFVHANVYSGRKGLRFSCCRYGNVLASRGSVVHTFQKCLDTGQSLPITDEAMTRFWISLPRVGRFLLRRVDDMEGGEIFVPEMNSLPVMDLGKFLWEKKFPELNCLNMIYNHIGVRPGEKVHECLIAPEELVMEESVAHIGMWDSPDPVLGEFEHYYTIVRCPTDPEHERTEVPLYSNSPKNHTLTKEEFFELLNEEV